MAPIRGRGARNVPSRTRGDVFLCLILLSYPFFKFCACFAVFLLLPGRYLLFVVVVVVGASVSFFAWRARTMINCVLSLFLPWCRALFVTTNGRRQGKKKSSSAKPGAAAMKAAKEAAEKEAKKKKKRDKKNFNQVCFLFFFFFSEFCFLSFFVFQPSLFSFSLFFSHFFFSDFLFLSYIYIFCHVA